MTRLNGCHNRAPFRSSAVMQDGWIDFIIDGNGTRSPRLVTVPFLMSAGCSYTHTDLGRADAGCHGCRWRAETANPTTSQGEL